MGRYFTDAVVCDNTSFAQWNCSRTVSGGQGACLLQVTGGAGGCATVGCAGTCVEWIVPAGVTSVVIELWGGGGGGGNAVTCCCCAHGGGGGGGAYSRKTLTVTPGSSYTVCAGGGGAGGGVSGMRADGACCCGAKGGTSYVTGTGLTNFCAEGGFGGESRQQSWFNINSPNGGWPGTGGDLNARGLDGGMLAGRGNRFCAGWSFGGGSPFGGKNMYIGHDWCAQYADDCGNGKWGGVCGFTGNFPGGGGTGGWQSCCCGICSCGGAGAPGLVRIWM